MSYIEKLSSVPKSSRNAEVPAGAGFPWTGFGEVAGFGAGATVSRRWCSGYLFPSL